MVTTIRSYLVCGAICGSGVGFVLGMDFKEPSDPSLLRPSFSQPSLSELHTIASRGEGLLCLHREQGRIGLH